MGGYYYGFLGSRNHKIWLCPGIFLLPPTAHPPLCPNSTVPSPMGRIVIFTGQRSYQTGSSAPSQNGILLPLFNHTEERWGHETIMDLRSLNKYITYRKFWMTTLESILPLLPPSSWMVTLDLRDAHFHTAIWPSHWRFL